MDVWRYVLVLLLNGLSLSRSLELFNISERVKPIMGETFFGPKELLHSTITDMDVFKRVFTLPKESQTSQFISGSATNICEKLSNLSANVDTLVITLNQSDGSEGQNTYPILCGIHKHKLYLLSIKQNIIELWIIIEETGTTSINLGERLEEFIVHIIGKTSEIVLDYTDFIGTQVLHLYNVHINFARLDGKLDISDFTYPTLCVLSITYMYPINASFVAETSTQNHNLKYLALTGDLLALPRHLASNFPDLRVLYISHNLRLDLDYFTFYTQTLLFHPNLQIFAMYFSLTKCEKYEISGENLAFNFKIFRGKTSGFGKCEKFICWDFLVNQSSQCRFLRCLLGRNFFCDKLYITTRNESGELTLVFPVSPKLQEFYCNSYMIRSYASLSPLWYAFMMRKFIISSMKGVYVYLISTPYDICEKPIRISNNSLVKVDYSQMVLDPTQTDQSFLWDSDASLMCEVVKAEIMDLENIEILYLNNVQAVDGENLFGIFNKSAQHKLKDIQLRNNNLNSPIELQLCVEKQSLESVDLSLNQIKEIPVLFLQGCKNLKLLNLSHNQIKVLPISVHEDIERLDITVDLSFNPLICDCHPEAKETLRHLHANRHKYEAFYEYVCFGHGQHIVVSGIDLDVHLSVCDQWTLPEIIGLCIGSFAGSQVLSLLIWLSIKYRYRLVKFLYNSRRKLLCKNTNRQNFPFDLYLVYDRDDRCFIHNIFIKAMEDISGFKCCVPFRDFPGEGIQSEFIHRYMDASRYVVVMLSRVSINKYWTAFEIERAQDLERRQGKTIFYVKLDNLGSDITHEVKKVLDAGNFTEWPKDYRNDNRGVQFFNKLISQIHSEELCDVCCTCSTPSSRLMPLDDQSVEMHICNQ